MRRLLPLAAVTLALVGAAAPPASAGAAPPYCRDIFVNHQHIGRVCVIGERCVVEGGGEIWDMCLVPWP